MTESIYGTWDTPHSTDRLEWLWHRLAAQNVGQANMQANNGLSQRKNEIIELWQLFVRQRPKVIVEIGTAQGGTFAGWCQLAPEDALLISVDRDINDCWPKPGHLVHPDISMAQEGGACALGRGRQRIVALNGWTHDPAVEAALTQLLGGFRTVDLLFHDASHESGMFQADFDWMWPLIKPGGIFAVHDIQPSSHPDVTKDITWRWIKANADYSAVYEYQGSISSESMGIGVLIK